CVKVDLLAALLVFKPELIKIRGRSFQAASTLHPALSLVIRQRVRRHHFSVVDAADDDRLIGISFEKVDDHLLSNSRNVNHSPLLARPHRPDSYPAGTVQIVFSLAVPVKLNLHATVLVGKYLFSWRADDHGGLGSLNERLRRGSHWAERQGERDTREGVLIAQVPTFARAIISGHAR